MPSGRTHAKVNMGLLIISSLTGGGALWIGAPLPLVLAGWAGLAAGTITTPDVDIVHLSHRIHEEERLHNLPHIGSIVGHLYEWYWTPYALNHPHRGPSHWPMWGTATRMKHGYWWLVPMIIWLGWGRPFDWWLRTLLNVMIFYAAWAIIDIVHIAMDHAVSELRGWGLLPKPPRQRGRRKHRG